MCLDVNRENFHCDFPGRNQFSDERFNFPLQMPMATSMDKEVIREAYEDVRSNLTGDTFSLQKKMFLIK